MIKAGRSIPFARFFYSVQRSFSLYLQFGKKNEYKPNQ